MPAKLARRRILAWVIGALAIGLLTAACGQTTAGAQQTPEKDKEIAALKAQVTKLEQDSKLAATLQQDATYWKQLTAVLEPVKMPAMTDHRAYMLPTGGVIALHFDNMKIEEAKNLNWVAMGVPGKFTKEEQARVEKQFGKGFTHFHDMKNDIHGGQPGAEGVWFVHVAVRNFDSPMSGGQVKAGIDEKFMPTPPTQ